jgi:Ca-activated chloride channel family protein
MLENFHFIRPLWLIALLIPLILPWLLSRRSSTDIWHKICDPNLLSHLQLINFGSRQKRIPLILLTIAWLLTILALAGPASKLPQTIYRAQHSIVLILDLSRTMDSRLERAKYQIWDILENYSQEAEIALIVFAGKAHVISPLTDDANTIAHYVRALKTELMPVSGKHPWFALQKADELLKQSGAKRAEILLITDNIDNQQQTLVQIQKLQKQGHHVSMLVDDSNLKDILKSIPFIEPNTKLMDKKAWQDQGYWLIFLLLPFALLSFRRGWLGILLLCVILPKPSYAFSWQDMWQRSDQQAAEILNQGIAYYQDGDYEEAAVIFAKLNNAQAHYNRGNALASSKQYQAAINAYKTALKKNPQYPSAQHNLSIVQKLLKQSQTQNQDDKQSKPKSGNKKRSGLSENKKPKQSEKGKGAVTQGKSTTDGANGQVNGTQSNQQVSSKPKQQEKLKKSFPQKTASHKPASKNNHTIENDDILEQRLENINSDIGELLERKFHYQIQQHQ